MPPFHSYYVQTMPGVERIAWLEIRQRLPRASAADFLFIKDQNGIVAFEYPGDTGDLLRLRTTEDVFFVVATHDRLSRDWRDLRAVADLIQGTSALDYAVHVLLGIKGTPTYRVISRKMGKHQYRRMDFEAAVVKGIQRRYKGRWQLVDDDAEVEIWANIIGSRLLCGVRLSDRSMRYRDYHAITLPAALRPSVAAALVFLTEPGPDDVFLDPMCGSGTILAERVIAGACRSVLGGDILLDRAHAAGRNLAPLKQRVQLCQWDAGRLSLATESVDKLAVNLPFGKQVGSRKEIEQLYPRFAAELERVLRPEGLAVVLTSEYDLLKSVLRSCETLRHQIGYSIAVLGQWARIYVVKRV
jgi:23S rRNA G2445 N2-methylase RlmL